ncbi:MAG: hypothetical protein PHD88_10495 [Firmicutes bacterium]|nr:hypothetical protein [Bacillota bacterium]MDD4694789.1 hypothetical protein [Bacillota bacterium]
MAQGLIIEGIPLTGKTSLLNGIERSDYLCNLTQSTKLIYHENLTQRVLEKFYNKGFLDKHSNIDFLYGITNHLLMQEEFLKLRGFPSNELIFILERFHLTHVAYYPSLKWEDVFSINESLNLLNTKVVLLTIDRNTFKTRLEERKDTGFANYIKRYGKDLETILDHYMKSQDHYLELADKSNLDYIVLPSHSLTKEEVLNQTLNFFLKHESTR